MIVVFILVLVIALFFIFASAVKDVSATVKSISTESAIKATTDYISCSDNKFDKTLTLKVRSPEIGRVLKILPDYDYQTTYKPKSIVYTGATVGGITTGGFHEEGGYEYVSGKTKNGKFNIYYGSDKVHPVKAIRLTNDLYQKAKSSKIARYLNKRKEIEVIIPPFSGAGGETRKKMVSSAGQTGNFALAQSLAEEEITKGYPSFSKCEEIVRWLCGED